MSKPREMVILPCGCGAGVPVVCPTNQIGEVVSCPWSGAQMQVIGERSFGLTEWNSTNKAEELDACLSAFERRFTERQGRLLACGLARFHFARYGSTWLWEAVAAGERWADDRRPPFGTDDIRRELRRRDTGGSPNLDEWVWLAEVCVSDFPGLPAHPGAAISRVLADVQRELFPNPFLLLAWNPDWFTSTVRDIASHIYAAHEFYSMRILADALQDAGCDDEQILTHCRGDRLHARGCWVLDAILGKS
jgi:hypothetical protein